MLTLDTLISNSLRQRKAAAGAQSLLTAAGEGAALPDPPGRGWQERIVCAEVWKKLLPRPSCMALCMITAKDNRDAERFRVTTLPALPGVRLESPPSPGGGFVTARVQSFLGARPH